jgi:hypothetical protein
MLAPCCSKQSVLVKAVSNRLRTSRLNRGMSADAPRIQLYKKSGECSPTTIQPRSNSLKIHSGHSISEDSGQTTVSNRGAPTHCSRYRKQLRPNVGCINKNTGSVATCSRHVPFCQTQLWGPTLAWHWCDRTIQLQILNTQHFRYSCSTELVYNIPNNSSTPAQK